MSFFAMTLSLFFVLNALGTAPLFVALLSSFNEKKQRQIIMRELLIALFILLLFNFFGENVMTLLGISHPALGVAGGTLLLLIAIGMIFPRTHDLVEIKRTEPMIVPLAVPLVAGPGSIATVMVYSEQIGNEWLSSAVLLCAWLPSLFILLLSSNLKKVLGQKGLMACQKMGGMLISLIAMNMICAGLTTLLRQALFLPGGK